MLDASIAGEQLVITPPISDSRRSVVCGAITDILPAFALGFGCCCSADIRGLRRLPCEPGEMQFRPIEKSELEVLRAWVDHDVPGAAALRLQLDGRVFVRSSCDCGCASIGFDHDETEPGVSIFDVDAEIVDAEGQSVGGMVLFLKNGKLHDIDLHSWNDELPFPELGNVRWHLRADQS